MLIGNLKDINSTSDLFNYITNIESELEDVNEEPLLKGLYIYIWRNRYG